MTYVSETSLTAIWHNIIQDITFVYFLLSFLTKSFIWDIWKFGRLSFWPLTKRSIGTQILFFMNAHKHLSQASATLECISHNQKRKYNPITDEARKERCLRKQPQTMKIYKSFKYMECINLVMVKIFSLSNIFMPQTNVSSNH